MPTLNITSIGQSGAQWYISDLSYPWNSVEYQSAYITYGGNTSAPVWAPVSGNSYSTSWGSISGLSAGTTYTATGYVVANTGITYTIGTYTFTTSSPLQPPSGTPSVSVEATYSGGQHYINVYWTSVFGATGYHIYANSYYKVTAYGTSTQITADAEYTLYSIAVYPYNSAGNGTAGTAAVWTKDVTPPVISSFTAPTAGTGANAITVNAVATDSGSGVSGFHFYKNGFYDGTEYGSSVSHQYTGLSTQTAYQLTCRAFDTESNLSASSTALTVTTKSNRPAPFNWTNQKSSGGDFNLAAAEWNALAAKVNAFRTYKSLGAYPFTTAYTDSNYEAYYFNQAVSAIGDMSPPTSLPSTVTSGAFIYASQLNGLVSSLNSIP